MGAESMINSNKMNRAMQRGGNFFSSFKSYHKIHSAQNQGAILNDRFNTSSSDFSQIQIDNQAIRERLIVGLIIAIGVVAIIAFFASQLDYHTILSGRS